MTPYASFCTAIDWRPMRSLFAAALIGILILPNRSYAQERVFFLGHWKEIGGTKAQLFAPRFPGLIAGDARRFLTFEYGDMHLRSYSYRGDLLWEWNARGPAAGLISASDLGLDDAGNALLTDRQSGKIAVIDMRGKLVRVIRVPDVSRAQPLESGGFITISSSDHPPWLVLHDSLGRSVRQLPFPRQLGEVHSLARDALVAATSELSAFAIVFLHAGWWIRGGNANDDIVIHQGIEPLQFPRVVAWETEEGHVVSRVDPKAVGAAKSVGLNADNLYVFFEGWSNAAGALVDVYDLRRGAYVRSWRLPSRIRRAAIVGENSIAAIIDGTMPVVRVWQWVPQ